MGCCTGTKFAVGVTVVLAIACVVLAAALIWRERSRPKETDTTLSVATIREKYPGMFRTEEEQLQFEQRYLSRFYHNRTIVNETTDFFTGFSDCGFICFDSPQRRRKRAQHQRLYHGCCESSLTFTAPKTQRNVYGNRRFLVQFDTAQQYFPVHTCRVVPGCTGCRCSTDEYQHTAVVVKSGVTRPDDIEDTEVDGLLHRWLLQMYQ